MKDNTQRFSTRVENYIRYRPRYPQGVFDTLKADCGLSRRSIIADIGSGTGFLAEGFLRLGCLVYGVEPNQHMREAGERHLHEYARFRSVLGTAEETSLDPASIDFVTAGQAFHWFDPKRAKAEFERILKPSGWIVLVWNERQGATYPFGKDYEKLLDAYAANYADVTHKRLDGQALGAFLGMAFKSETFENSQSLDFEGLKGRLLSSSYAPEAGHPDHEPMLADLQSLFDAHQVKGRVDFLYQTKLYYNRGS